MIHKGFVGALVYLTTSYLLGLLSQLGREHAKEIAYAGKERERNYSRRHGYAPPKVMRREFMPEMGTNGHTVTKD